MASFIERIKNGWNAFSSQESTNSYALNLGPSYSYRPDRVSYSVSNEKSVIDSIYNRLAIDVASIEMQHVKLDQNGRYLEQVNSGLNNCLTLEANIDQSSRAFRQDAAMTLFEKGCIAIVPVDTKLNPMRTDSYDILSMRVGEIIEWYPRHVKISLYNDRAGRREEITMPKSIVGIIENPLYSIMNEPNSTLKRLIRKLSLLDVTDERNSSGKLDLIIQLPYVIKSDARQKQAEARRQAIEGQLVNSKYGIAYADGTERITQLNRPVENNLLAQIKELKADLYNQLGLTEEIFKGIANEQAMLNYYTRTIEPVIAAITEEIKRKFLTKTARTQGHSVEYFRDPFSLVPVAQIANIADKFTRNEILSSNEVRQIIGYKPVSDSRADELRNKNMPLSEQPEEAAEDAPETALDSILYDKGYDV